MESVQFFSFGKVEGNSRDNGQKSQTGEDTFSDIMEQSLGQVNKEKEPEKEQEKDDKQEGIIVPAQMLVFPNQIPTEEEFVMPSIEPIQVLTETEVQTNLEQQVDMAGLEQPLELTGQEQSVSPAELENPMDLAAPQTDGEHIQTADAAGLIKTEPFQLKSPEVSPSEPETQKASEGVKAETKAEIRSEEHEPKETVKEDITVQRNQKEEKDQTSGTVEVMNREGIQSPVNTLYGKSETVSHETVHVHVSQPEELPQELAKELIVKNAVGSSPSIWKTALESWSG